MRRAFDWIVYQAKATLAMCGRWFTHQHQKFSIFRLEGELLSICITPMYLLKFFDKQNIYHISLQKLAYLFNRYTKLSINYLCQYTTKILLIIFDFYFIIPSILYCINIQTHNKWSLTSTDGWRKIDFFSLIIFIQHTNKACPENDPSRLTHC